MNETSFVTLLEIVSTMAILMGFVGLTSFLSDILKIQPPPIAIGNPKRESIGALFLAAFIFIATASLEAIRFVVYRPLFQLDERPPFTVDYYDVGFSLLFYTPWIVLLLVAMKRTSQDWRSIGVSSINWRRILLFGSLLCLLYFGIVGIFAAPLSSGISVTTISLFYGMLNNSIIGTCEELVWRGHIQTRLIAQLGSLKGLASTSVLFAFLHFPQRYFLYSGAILEALSSVVLVIAAGLLFGYIMMKSQNVLASGVFHIIANWTALFWSIGSF